MEHRKQAQNRNGGAAGSGPSLAILPVLVAAALAVVIHNSRVLANVRLSEADTIRRSPTRQSTDRSPVEPVIQLW